MTALNPLPTNMSGNGVYVAFGLLLEEIVRVTGDIKQAADTAARAGRIDEARELLSHGSRLGQFRQRVMDLQQQW